MPTSPSSQDKGAATPAAAAKPQRNGPTWTARISLLAIPLLAVALSRRRGPRVFTKAELAQYVDTSRGLKVAICGQVFDVSKGAEFYAKGAGYGFFAGRDASLAFATGNFKTNLTDNVGAPASFFERRVDGVPLALQISWRASYHVIHNKRGMNGRSERKQKKHRSRRSPTRSSSTSRTGSTRRTTRSTSTRASPPARIILQLFPSGASMAWWSRINSMACRAREIQTATPTQVVAGYFYDAKGQPTEAHKDFDERVEKAREAAARQALDVEQYPDCASRRTQTERSVSCKKGRVPIRRRTETGTERCACVLERDEGLGATYENCTVGESGRTSCALG